MARFGVKEVADVTFYDISSGKPVLFFDTLKMSNLENQAQTVYAQGGKGAPRIMGWDFNRTASFKMQDALISPQSLSILSGTTMQTGAQVVYKREVLTVVAGSGGSITNPTAAPTLTTATTGGALAAATYFVKYTWVNANGETLVSPEASVVTTGTVSTVTVTLPAFPAGVTSANIYISTSTNTETKQGSTTTTTFTQTAALVAGVAVPVSNTATITSGTNVTLSSTPIANSISIYQTADGGKTFTTALTIGTITAMSVSISGGTPAVALGDTVVVFYQYSTSLNSNLITITANQFPAYYKVVADTIVRNEVTGLDESFQVIIPKSKLLPTFTITLDSSNISVFNFDLEVFKDTYSQNMIQMIKY